MSPISRKLDITFDYPIMGVIFLFCEVDNWKACASRYYRAFSKKLIAKFFGKNIWMKCSNDLTIDAYIFKNAAVTLNQKITGSQTINFFLQTFEL